MDNSTKEKLVAEVQNLLLDYTDQEYQEILNSAAFRRPWRPKRTGWINVFDQFLHVSYAAIVLLPAWAWPSLWAAAASGFLLGLIREAEQYRNQDLHILMFWDRFQDVTFFTVGSMLIYYVASRFI
jgi:hypothetical protein